MKKLESQSSEENISPNKGTMMMKNWLAKASASKKTEKTVEKKSHDSPIKNHDSNKMEKKVEKVEVLEKVKKPAKKIIESEEEEEEEKKTAKKQTTTKSKKKTEEFDDDADEDMKNSKANKKSKLVAEKADTSTTAAAKKPGNKYYAAYMRREGPKNPGSKPIPIGKKNCFEGLKFLITGVLDSIDRDECKSIVEKYGGSVVSGVTKKLDYLIVGEDAGEAKLNKADELNIKKINEDEFLKLICEKSGITNPKYEGDDQQQMNVDEEEKEPIQESVVEKKKGLKALRLDSDDEQMEASTSTTTKVDEIKKKSVSPMKKEVVVKQEPKKEIKMEIKQEPKQEPKQEVKQEVKEQAKKPESEAQNELWVEKYKPKAMNKIIGQSTEKSNANKLLNWLKNWEKWNGAHSGKVKKPWNDQETGSSFKAALLSGPPGIGKTTTANLVCKEAGFTFIELNASDSRSKKLLSSVLGESVESASIDSYFKSKHKVTETAKDKHCIIMDEVDGMAGNEDRGGVAELINVIKHSKIPIICICNDRQHIKIRSLANYCFDLRFYKPRIEQVRAALLSICCKENIQITPELVDQIIIGCNYDIRQCLHNLSMWSSNNKVLTKTQSTSSDIEKAMKDIRMNPFEACKQVFSIEKESTSLMDKMDLFFTDYSLMPLLVHENYLAVKPAHLKGNTKQQKDRHHLELLSDSIQSMMTSDRIGRLIRTHNNWSLLSTQGVFATVLPGEKLRGAIGLPAFPSWFGKNSKKGRTDRILQELQKHMRLRISANKLGVGMEYLSVMKTMLTKPLIKQGNEGIPKVIELMNEYCLTREDFDTILELATWPGEKDPASMIDSKVKASFTRTYNKESHKNPFSIVNVKKLKGSKLDDELGEYGEEEGQVEEEEEKEEDINEDAMIKVNAKPKKSAATSSKAGTKRTADSSETNNAKKKKTK